MEMRAIASVIGETDLQNLLRDLIDHLPRFDDGESGEKWLKDVSKFGDRITKLQGKSV